MSRVGAAERSGLVVLYLAWGATYPVMRLALRYLPPFTLLSLRCLIGAVPLLLLARWRGEPWPTRRTWAGSLLVGALALGGGHGLTTYGVEHVTGGFAALLVSMVSVWLALFSWLLLREPLGRRAVLGLVLGFAGVALLAGAGLDGRFPPLAVVALIVSPVAWASGSLLGTRVALPRGPVMATAAQLLVCVPLFAVVAAIAGEPDRLGPRALSGTAIWTVVFLAVIGYSVAFGAYTWLSRSVPFSVLGTYAYVNPLVAVALGAWFLGEPVTGRMVWGGGMILLGVALVVVSAGRRPDAQPVPLLTEAATRPVLPAEAAAPAPAVEQGLA